MLEHLIELRRRLFYSIICFAVFFIIYFHYASTLFQYLSQPLRQVLPQDSKIIATQIISTVITPLKLAFHTALISSLPFLLYQLWRFIAPGLYKHERQQFRILILTTCILFLTGLLFCYFIAMPILFRFFSTSLPTGVQLMPDMALNLDFILYMMMLFGLCFQLPLICLVMAKMQWITVTQYKNYRPYVIVSAFILGMLLTPPDVISQIILALPLCLLYEVGILLASIVEKPQITAKNEIKPY
jgi:sec-independent protein translocase protein TatC